jgi:hypothetical protein
MLYHLLPEAPRSTYDLRQKTRPHSKRIVGYDNVNSTDSVMNQIKELSLNNSVGRPSSYVSSNPTHSVDVHLVQSSTNLNGNQPLGGNKKKGRNNHKGGKNGNKSKDNIEKKGNSAREGK